MSAQQQEEQTGGAYKGYLDWESALLWFPSQSAPARADSRASSVILCIPQEQPICLGTAEGAQEDQPTCK